MFSPGLRRAATAIDSLSNPFSALAIRAKCL